MSGGLSHNYICVETETWGDIPVSLEDQMKNIWRQAFPHKTVNFSNDAVEPIIVYATQFSTDPLNKVLGQLALHDLHTSTPWIGALAVGAQFRRSGIAKKLVQRAIKTVESLTYGRRAGRTEKIVLYLTVERGGGESEEWLVQFYKNMGFEEAKGGIIKMPSPKVVGITWDETTERVLTYSF